MTNPPQNPMICEKSKERASIKANALTYKIDKDIQNLPSIDSWQHRPAYVYAGPPVIPAIDF
jgi:hypothetical protein